MINYKHVQTQKLFTQHAIALDDQPEHLQCRTGNYATGC